MLKALVVAQIGDVPVRLYREDYDGYDLKYSLDVVRVARGRRLYFGDRSRSPNNLGLKMKGKVISSSQRSIDQQFTELAAIGGGEVDIIAYSFYDCCADVDCCGTCGNVNNSDLIWLHTRGAITDLDLGGKDSVGEISVNLMCRPEWQPLNRLLWHYGTNRESLRQVRTLNSSILRDLGKLPTPNAILSAERACAGQIFSKRRYSDDLVMYSPDVWAALHKYLRPTYLTTGYGYDWEYMPLYDTDGRYRLEYSIFSDQTRWSAEPTSLYAIRNLVASSELTITVERRIRNQVFDSTERLTTLNVFETHQTLVAAELGGLLATDIVVIGDTERLPGFIIRDDAILEDIYPSVSYPDEHPGELGIATSYITIDATSVLPVEVARLHTFRRL